MDANTDTDVSFVLSLHDLRQLSPIQEERYLTDLFGSCATDSPFFVLLTRNSPLALRELASSYMEDDSQLDVVTGLTVHVQEVVKEVAKDYQQIMELRHLHSLLLPFKGFLPTLFNPMLPLLKGRASSLNPAGYSESVFGHCPRLHLILQFFDLFSSGSGLGFSPNSKSIDPKVPVLLSRLRFSPAQTVLGCFWLSQLESASCIDVLQLSLVDIQPVWTKVWQIINPEVSMGVH